MRINVVDSLAEPVGALWREAQHSSITSRGGFSVSSPLSSTPLPIYSWIIKHADTFTGWDKVTFVLMDEQVDGASAPFRYVGTADEASYERFATRNLLGPLTELLGHSIPVAKPRLASIDKFALGQPLDLLILALGPEGNYANVMPGTPREASWHIARLSPEFRAAHTQQDSASYAGARFREYGMSLGHRQVLEARQVVVVISGEKKRCLASELLSCRTFRPQFPLSIIHDQAVRERVSVYLTDELMDLAERFSKETT